MIRIVDSRLVLAVRNLEASTRFYTEVLGFTHHQVDAAGWSFLSRDKFTIMIGECPDETPASELGDQAASVGGHAGPRRVVARKQDQVGLGSRRLPQHGLLEPAPSAHVQVG